MGAYTLTTPVRVLLADDHELVLAAFRALLRKIEGVEVVAEALDGHQATELAEKHRPDVAVLDISMHGLNGIEACERIRTASPSTRVIMLSSHSDAASVTGSLKAGARAYVTKDATPAELHFAIAAVMRGDYHFSSRVLQHLVTRVRGEPEGRPSPLEALSTRQREVLQLIGEGQSTKRIAVRLGLSVKTIETHRAAIMERLEIRDIAGLVVFALKHGLIAVDGLDRDAQD